ncbi:MAG: hypothetical protein L6420_02555 [Elusimicrobia bacterium]|nr:hypothetical protein [Elusimicrobiota bacterium]
MVSQEIPPSHLKKVKNLKSKIMKIAEDMKRVAEEIVSSYQSRISTVAMIVDDTRQLLEDFKTRRNEMSDQLKDILSKEESLRKKDFDDMMQDILSHQDEREKEVRNLLKTFFEEQKEIAEVIKKSLTGTEKVRIDDFRKMLQDIQVRQKAREDEIRTRLEAFQEEYKEMAESLHSLLNKGEAIRIKDFKEMVKNIRIRQSEREEEIRKKLDEFRKEHFAMASHWHKITDSLKGSETEEKKEVAKV